jgi:hypothetical protein
LVDSIVVPATDPAAAEVFYRINASRAPGVTINQLLKQMKEARLPLLLLWGDLDPWITPSRVRLEEEASVGVAMQVLSVERLCWARLVARSLGRVP